MMKPVIGIIGGTGFAEALTEQTEGRTEPVDTPFGPPSSPVLTTQWNGLDIAYISRHGDGHVHPPSAVAYRANIFALKTLGVTHILASGAVGSLSEDIAPRDLVVVDQVIDKTCRRVGTFFEDGIAVHVEFSNPFCADLRRRLLDAAGSIDARVHDGGTYVCMEGPAFSTRAESHTHRGWNGHLIGMTCMPEAKLAREAEICYALVALVTDYDCWRPHQPGLTTESLLIEIVGHLQSATENAIALIRATVEKMSTAPPGRSPIHDGLKLAIWSDKNKVDPAVVDKLKPILGKYF
jgi:5'-methylthioadenosine phosphorylase